jgi:hypothetical protein
MPIGNVEKDNIIYYREGQPVVMRELGKKHIKKMSKGFITVAQMAATACRKEDGTVDSKKMAHHPVLYFGKVGVIMEDVNALLMKLNEATEESVEVIQETYNDVLSVSSHLIPELGDLIKKVRDKRGAVVRELSQTLNMMKDVRKFFLEKDYETEVERLERFCSVAERLRTLMDDGTLDAISDIILKLHMTEEGVGK